MATIGEMVLLEESLRKNNAQIFAKNANVCITMSDGTTHFPTSGGIAFAGVDRNAVKNADFLTDIFQAIQEKPEEKLIDLMPLLIDRGHAGEPEIEVKLLALSEIEVKYFFQNTER